MTTSLGTPVSKSFFFYPVLSLARVRLFPFSFNVPLNPEHSGLHFHSMADMCFTSLMYFPGTLCLMSPNFIKFVSLYLHALKPPSIILEQIYTGTSQLFYQHIGYTILEKIIKFKPGQNQVIASCFAWNRIFRQLYNQMFLKVFYFAGQEYYNLNKLFHVVHVIEILHRLNCCMKKLDETLQKDFLALLKKKENI